MLIFIVKQFGDYSFSISATIAIVWGRKEIVIVFVLPSRGGWDYENYTLNGFTFGRFWRLIVSVVRLVVLRLKNLISKSMSCFHESLNINYPSLNALWGRGKVTRDFFVYPSSALHYGFEQCVSYFCLVEHRPQPIFTSFRH